MNNTFGKGHEYRRREIHEVYGGQRQGGISTPSRYPLILVFTGDRGKDFGYEDGWTDGVFYYSGEGQYGDMVFKAGNKAIRDHIAIGKALLVFKQTRHAHVEFAGEFVCTGYHYAPGVDANGATRRKIVFELVPIEDQEAQAGHATEAGELSDAVLGSRPLAELRQLALAAAQPNATAKQRLSWYRERSQAVKAYVLRRANGVCEGCSEPAPFKTKKGLPYLEPHHTRRLADDGPDDPRWVVAVCPNCHRRVHYGEDGQAYNKELILAANQKE